MRSTPNTGRAIALAIVLVSGVVTLTGCGGLTEADRLPPNVWDPTETQSPRGALATYYGVHVAFLRAFDAAVRDGALLTDELGNGDYGRPQLQRTIDLDIRDLPEGTILTDRPTYGFLHRVRGQASEAIGLLVAHLPDSSAARRAHVSALAGYAEVFLADLYCSGIPLSTVDFKGDFTLRPGSATDQVYEHALALFDTALALGVDSAAVLHFAQMGRGRALLALGRYAEAGQTAAAVPDSFSYVARYDAGGNPDRTFVAAAFNAATMFDGNGATVTDGEGGGLPYRSSGDPRVGVFSAPVISTWGISNWKPAKYPNGRSPLVVADWIEARLIEAEAALQVGDTVTWLQKLNHLRQTAWPTIVPAVAGPLPDTTDPGTPAGRVDLLFRERAFWLYLTGHRQGDLRRLIRQYGRNPTTVYPSGPYPGGYGSYGNDITMPVPLTERELNPQYTGCIHRGA